MLRNRALISALFAAGVLTAGAQSSDSSPSTNSPYTRYGLGDLSDMVFTNNAAMGGVGYALRTSEHINPMNPASYTSVDSLSFMFDVGMTLKSSNYQEAGVKSNAKNSSFDYIAAQFRLHPRLAIAVGYIPYSTVGYSFSRSAEIENSGGVTNTNTFFGEGGTQQILGGLGFKILDNLSIGANISYLYGTFDYQSAAIPSNGGDRTVVYNTLSVKSYKADFGLQYTHQINKNNSLTLGLAYSMGHQLNCTDTYGTQVIGRSEETTSSGTTDSYVVLQSSESYARDGYGIPHVFGGGLAWNYSKKLTVEADYTLQKWSSVKYNNRTGMYKDRSKVAFGAEYLPNEIGRSYLARMKYRVGAYYSTPYVKVPYQGNMIDGATEFGVSAGFGLPLQLYQRNSILSITGQYVRVNPSVTGMLSENRFVIKLGLTFNERWFMKWRVN